MIAGILFVALMTALTAVLGDLPTFFVITLFAFFLATIFVVDTYVSNIPSVEELEQRIVRKMESEGYRCKKDEGVLEYTMNSRVFESYFWRVDKNFFRTMIIDRANIDEDWDKISAEGKAVLDNYVNRECYHSSFLSNEYGCSCAYTTFVRTPSDFLNEAKSAYDVIGKAFNTAIDILPQIKEKYPNSGQSDSIGFVRRENGDNNENY